MKEAIKKAAEEHEAKGGGRSAFSFICGAEYIIDQMRYLLKHPYGKFLLEEYINKMKDTIRNID